MTSTARQVVFPRVGAVELGDISVPDPAPGDLLVRIRRVGICATDLHILDGHIGDPFPVVPGHEFVGDVAAIGATAAADRGLAVGDRVSVEMLLPCARCDRCREGRYNLCRRDDPAEAGFRGGQYGINIGRDRAPGLWGGYAEMLLAPAEAIVHRLPDELEWDVLALVEPLAVAFRTVSRARIVPGDRVVVVGPGPVGMLIAAAARTAGASRVVMIGTRESRLRGASAFGVDATVLTGDDAVAQARAAFGGAEADAVIEIAGTPAAQQLAVGLVRRGGRVVLAGACGGGTRVAFLADEELLTREIDVLPSFLSAGGYEPAIAALTRGDYPYADLVTHRFPLEDAASALELVRSKQDNVMKAVLVPHE